MSSVRAGRRKSIQWRARERAATSSERCSHVIFSAEGCLKGPSRSGHGEGNRQQLGPERLLDLSGVAGGDKLDAAGKQTVLYSFTCGADGYGPAEGVIRDAAGTFYGTTTGGSTGNSGVVFKVDLSGHETVLYNFTGGTDGDQPYAGVIRDSAGNLYGTTAVGGASGFGAVYKLDKSGHQTVPYSFTGGSDGCSPQAGLIRDSDGNLYGTNPNCGSAYAGTVYKVDARGGETHFPMVLAQQGKSHPRFGRQPVRVRSGGWPDGRRSSTWWTRTVMKQSSTAL